MKKCPYCSEEIQDEAIKCRYCGEFLNENDDKITYVCIVRKPWFIFEGTNEFPNKNSKFLKLIDKLLSKKTEVLLTVDADKSEECIRDYFEKSNRKLISFRKLPVVYCRQCGGEMAKKTYYSYVGLGIFIFLVGFILCSKFILIGIMCLVFGICLVFKHKEYWVCKDCGYNFETRR